MFPLDSPDGPPPPSQGDAAAAIREAETALAWQNSVAAQVDLQVVTAVLGATSAHAEGSAALAALQRDIQSAVATRTDLDTPAGAREFQRYLLDRLQEIRTVVDDTRLDDTSRAALAAALASLYATASAAPEPAAGAVPSAPSAPGSPPLARLPGAADPSGPAIPAPALPAGDPLDLGLAPAPDSGLDPGLDPGLADLAALPADPAPPASTMPTAAQPPPAPSWGGGLPTPALPGLGGLSPLTSALSDLPEPDLREPDLMEPDPPPSEDPEDPDEPAGGAADEEEQAGDENRTDGSRPELIGVIADAVAGVPIAAAFDQHGITIPAAGATLDAPLSAAEVVRGDIGVFADRHALALGNGKALLDNQIQPIDAMNSDGFLGWLHPPAAAARALDAPAPAVPAPPADQ